MKIGKAQPRRERTIDMVPMINFAFLLLIFVILVGALSAPDVLAVRPPRSIVQIPSGPTPDLVVIDASGRIGFEGQLVGPDALLLRAQQWQATAGGRKLSVKADADAEAERVVLVLETLRAAGVGRVSLLTTQRR